MSGEKHVLDNYKKFLLNRVTASSVIVECIENCLATEDKAAKHYFHKIMVNKLFTKYILLFYPPMVLKNYPETNLKNLYRNAWFLTLWGVHGTSLFQIYKTTISNFSTVVSVHLPHHPYIIISSS